MNIIEQAAAAGVQGFLHPSEGTKLEELAAGRDVLEVGSYCGLSAWIMARVAKSVTCCDTFKACTNGQDQREDFQTLDAFMNATRGFSNVTAYIGQSETAAKDLKGKWDMVFIDAMHTRKDVRADIKRWWTRIRAGGVLVGHDYRHADFPGVEQAFDEVFGPAPEGTTVVTLRWIQK